MSSTATAEEIIKQLNRSGYPFQLRVEQEVVATFQEHGWLVASREQPWSTEDGGSGFIDIVLSHNHFTTCRLVLECKRIKADDQRQLSWIFLIPGASSQKTGMSERFQGGVQAERRTACVITKRPIVMSDNYISPRVASTENLTTE